MSSAKGHGDKGRQEELALAALLQCPTIEAAAEQAKISPATLRRWLQDPAFAARYKELRRQVVQHAITQVQGAMSAAAAALIRNLDCGVPSSEIQAARTIFERGHEAIELEDVLQRLDEIERSQAGRKEGAG